MTPSQTRRRAPPRLTNNCRYATYNNGNGTDAPNHPVPLASHGDEHGSSEVNTCLQIGVGVAPSASGPGKGQRYLDDAHILGSDYQMSNVSAPGATAGTGWVQGPMTEAPFYLDCCKGTEYGAPVAAANIYLAYKSFGTFVTASIHGNIEYYWQMMDSDALLLLGQVQNQ